MKIKNRSLDFIRFHVYTDLKIYYSGLQMLVYITVQQAAITWKISVCRMQKLCEGNKN